MTASCRYGYDIGNVLSTAVMFIALFCLVFNELLDAEVRSAFGEFLNTRLGEEAPSLNYNVQYINL